VAEGANSVDTRSTVTENVRYSPGMTDPDRPVFALDIHLDTMSGGRPCQQQLAPHSCSDAADLAYCISAICPHPTPLNMHAHEGMEMGMVLTGSEEQQFGSITLKRRPGDVWLCSMWEPHAWRVEKAGTRKVVLIFLPEFLGEDAVGNLPHLDLFRLPPDRRPRAVSRQARAQLLSLGRALAKEIDYRRPYWRSVVRLYMLLILADLVRLHQQSAPSNGEAAAGVDHTQLARVMPAVRLIQESPWGRLSTAEAAGACALSPSRFSWLFRNAMGVSFGAFSQRARLTFAVQQLLYTGQTVREVADAAGFVDSSHFHRVFAKHYGCSPGTYRTRAR
jgi:AraC-like DNA-binding protein